MTMPRFRALPVFVAVLPAAFALVACMQGPVPRVRVPERTPAVDEGDLTEDMLPVRPGDPRPGTTYGTAGSRERAAGRPPRVVVGEGAGARRRGDPRESQFLFRIGGGFGNLDHETEGSSGVSGDEQASLFRVQFEGGSRAAGGGFRFESTSSADDMFRGPGQVPAEAFSFEFMPYFVARPGARWFDVPLRVGVPVQMQTLDFANDDRITWLSGGIQAEVEPEVWLVEEENVSLSVFGGGGIGVLGTAISAESGPVDENYSSTGRSLRAEGGLRLGLFGAEITASYLFRETRIDESDVEAGTFVREMTQSWQGVVISGGMRF